MAWELLPEAYNATSKILKDLVPRGSVSPYPRRLTMNTYKLDLARDLIVRAFWQVA